MMSELGHFENKINFGVRDFVKNYQHGGLGMEMSRFESE